MAVLLLATGWNRTLAAQESGGPLPVMERAVGSAAAVARVGNSPHVRPLVHGRLDSVALMETALARSATIRGIVADLEHSDVVVWIELLDRLPASNSCLRMMGTAGGVRRLHIAISARHDHVDRMKWLGHELWHAREISRAPDVIDGATMEALFRRIGEHLWPGSSHYETAAAIAAGRSVLADLRQSAAGLDAGARRASR